MTAIKTADLRDCQKNARSELMTTIRALQKDAVDSGAGEMTMEEIDAEIAAYRKEKRNKRVV